MNLRIIAHKGLTQVQKEVSQQTHFRKTKRRLNSMSKKGLLMARLIDIDHYLLHTTDTDFQVTSSQRECLCAHAQKATSVLVAILKKDGNFFQ